MRFYSLLIVVASGLILSSCNFNELSDYSIIPVPQKLEPGPGKFKIKPETQILVYGELDDYKNEIDLFNKWLRIDLSSNFTDNKEMKDNTIIITQIPSWEERWGKYELNVGRFGIEIKTGGAEGAFYAFQTIRQLIESGSGKLEIPSVDIKDHPEFEWRGLMLDCSRTFLPVEYLKKQ